MPWPWWSKEFPDAGRSFLLCTTEPIVRMEIVLRSEADSDHFPSNAEQYSVKTHLRWIELNCSSEIPNGVGIVLSRRSNYLRRCSRASNDRNYFFVPNLKPWSRAPLNWHSGILGIEKLNIEVFSVEFRFGYEFSVNPNLNCCAELLWHKEFTLKILFQLGKKIISVIKIELSKDLDYFSIEDDLWIPFSVTDIWRFLFSAEVFLF